MVRHLGYLVVIGQGPRGYSITPLDQIEVCLDRKLTFSTLEQWKQVELPKPQVLYTKHIIIILPDWMVVLYH